MDLSDILASACELANARAAKILGVRADQHAALSITEFVEIFKENWEFVVATETLAKRMIVSLRGVTASQVSNRSWWERAVLISRPELS
jgi:vacuolar protein sorting-associated protein 54